MCYGSHRLPSKDPFRAVEDLRLRLAETEARLERDRVRETELSRQLDEMKRFVSVMAIQLLTGLLSSPVHKISPQPPSETTGTVIAKMSMKDDVCHYQKVMSLYKKEREEIGAVRHREKVISSNLENLEVVQTCDTEKDASNDDKPGGLSSFQRSFVERKKFVDLICTRQLVQSAL